MNNVHNFLQVSEPFIGNVLKKQVAKLSFLSVIFQTSLHPFMADYVSLYVTVHKHYLIFFHVKDIKYSVTLKKKYIDENI